MSIDLDEQLAPPAPRVVIAHDYLTQLGGAERVVLALLQAFPDAPVVTSVYNPASTYPEFKRFEVRVSPLQRIPAVARNPRLAVGLLPRVWKDTVIDGADLVICSSTGFAHGVTTAAPKLVYCHNPPRWLYQPEDYLMGRGALTRSALTALRPYLLRMDKAAAASATRYVANSTVVAGRIFHNYRLPARVIHPAAGVDPHGSQQPVAGIDPGFLLSVARPRGYKNVVAVEGAVAAIPGARLISVGNMPNDTRSSDPRITRLANVTDAELRWLYANCAALVAASHEDFGLTPVEAARFGKPTVALAADGYLDTIRPGITGIFFEEPTVESIRDGILRLRHADLSAEDILEHSQRFTVDRFVSDIRVEAYDLLGLSLPAAV